MLVFGIMYGIAGRNGSVNRLVLMSGFEAGRARSDA